MVVRQVIPRDAIPSIDDPRFGESYPWDDSERAIVVEGAAPRAYPRRILDYHEIVNDVVETGGGRRPIAVTWCPLCGSAVVYDRRVGDRTLTFGVSGKLADDDLVLYDRETESEWKQSAGEAIAGPLDGERLTVRPATTTSVGRFRETYPDGLVLQPDPAAESEAASEGDDPEPVDYDDRPYAGYFSADGFGLAAHRGSGGREWDRDDIDPKTVVLGIERDGEAVGVPAPTVDAADGLLELTLGSTAVIVVSAAGLDAYEDPGYEFSLETAPDSLPETGGSARRLVADGTTWDPVTGESTDGRRLDRVPARRLFAFAWQDDHGPAAFYTPEDT